MRFSSPQPAFTHTIEATRYSASERRIWIPSNERPNARPRNSVPTPNEIPATGPANDTSSRLPADGAPPCGAHAVSPPMPYSSIEGANPNARMTSAWPSSCSKTPLKTTASQTASRMGRASSESCRKSERNQKLGLTATGMPKSRNRSAPIAYPSSRRAPASTRVRVGSK